MAHDPEIRVMGNMREHVLHRPDTYLGTFRNDSFYVPVVKNGKIVYDNVTFNPAWERTVIEIGSNCIDNVWRSSTTTKCTTIRMNIYQDGSISFWNDGRTIPIERSRIPGYEQMFNPSIVFGVYMSSTNYNDNEKRRTSGRNGFGSKLTSTFSKWFKVETQDATRNLHFTQVWMNNMTEVTAPQVVSKSGTGYTFVHWLPDYQKFGMPGITSSSMTVLQKYAYDIAMLTKVKVYFNDVLVPVKNLADYASMYSEEKSEVLAISLPDNEVAIMASNNPAIVAFTNGIPQPEGGVHVDAWHKVLFTEIASRLNAELKDDKCKITGREVASHFSLFINYGADNPKFTSQEKVKLSLPKPEIHLDAKFLNKIMKWPVITTLKELIESKIYRVQKKKMEGTGEKHLNIEKLDDANLAGTIHSMECILFICEGDSAATFVTKGLAKGLNGKTGRDYLGILPLRGKILNTQKANAEKIAESKQVQNIIQALGLKLGVDYSKDENLVTLRYGALVLVTDADDDGIHIEGLIHNNLLKMFPGLMSRTPSFVMSMKTPIIRLTMKNGEERKFYRQSTFKDFQANNEGKYGKPKYFKGLGTNRDKDILDGFGSRMQLYLPDPNMVENFKKVFGKNNAEARKDWIRAYNEDNFMFIGDEKAQYVSTTYSNFINTEVINFSITSNIRAIPSVFDGLKQSQRKIIFACFKKKIVAGQGDEIKVVEVAAHTTAIAEYHYNDKCLSDAAVCMAQDFIGAGNINYLEPAGQFGSRLKGGKDAAETRYVMTRLEKIMPYLFRAEDFPVLTYRQGEKGPIEPEYYVPIIPTILVNGCDGIGTGWSTSIPAFNPLDIVRALRIWIRENLDEITTVNIGKSKLTFSELPELLPWYRGFRGTVKKVGYQRYQTEGVVQLASENSVHITELPIGKWTSDFKETLKELREKEVIEDFIDHSSAVRVDFTLIGNPENILKHLNLVTKLSTSNMTAFIDYAHPPETFDSVDQIIFTFAKERLRLYQVRKEYILANLLKRMTATAEKYRFIQAVVSDQIVIFKKKKAEILQKIQQANFQQIDGSHEYLLKIPVSNFCYDMIEKLAAQYNLLRKEYDTLLNTSARQMWEKELNEFERAYIEHYNQWAENQMSMDIPNKNGNRKKVPKRTHRRK